MPALADERVDRAEAVQAIGLAAALRFGEHATVGGVARGAVSCNGELVAGCELGGKPFLKPFHLALTPLDDGLVGGCLSFALFVMR